VSRKLSLIVWLIAFSNVPLYKSNGFSPIFFNSLVRVHVVACASVLTTDLQLNSGQL